jgi:hypothetical protein
LAGSWTPRHGVLKITPDWTAASKVRHSSW